MTVEGPWLGQVPQVLQPRVFVNQLPHEQLIHPEVPNRSIIWSRLSMTCQSLRQRFQHHALFEYVIREWSYSKNLFKRTCELQELGLVLVGHTYDWEGYEEILGDYWDY